MPNSETIEDLLQEGFPQTSSQDEFEELKLAFEGVPWDRNPPSSVLGASSRELEDEILAKREARMKGPRNPHVVALVGDLIAKRRALSEVPKTSPAPKIELLEFSMGTEVWYSLPPSANSKGWVPGPVWAAVQQLTGIPREKLSGTRVSIHLAIA